MEKEVIAAIIGAIAVVIAAIISGIFALRKQDKSKEPTQTAHAGGHSFQAAGNAHQNINIAEVKPVVEKLPDQLLVTVSEIKEYTNGILIENQQILNPLFAKEPNADKVRAEMIQLFGVQRARGKFGDWIAFLEHEQEKETDLRINNETGKLIALLNGLHESFYSYAASPSNKSYIISRLGSGDISILEIRKAATNYLEHLRSSIERIGTINGRIKSLKSKSA